MKLQSPFIKESEESIEGGYIYIPNTDKSISLEKAKIVEKAKMDDSKIDFSDIYEHPYDYNITRGIYKEMGIVSGIIDKYVDTIIGPGFHVKSKNKRAEQIITDYIRDVNLSIALKPAMKEALVTGFGPLEETEISDAGVPLSFEPINSATLYKRKDKKGYRQIQKGVGKADGQDFKESEIIVFSVNKMPGQRYGTGIIYSALSSINNYIKSNKDLHRLMERKANSPIHVKLGDAEKRIVPSEASINSYGSKLHYMRNVTEWCTDPYVEMKVLDFGNIGEKFAFVIENDYKNILESMQMPEVVIGKGSIPEGLAKVQLDLWDRTIFAHREDFEKIIEGQIFKKVLDANKIQAEVELYWDKPGEQAKIAEVTSIIEIMKLPFLDNNLRIAMEQRVAERMDIDYKQQTDEEKKKELAIRQPQVPGQNASPPKQEEESYFNIIEEAERVNALDEDITIKEWVGYNYDKHINYTEEFIDSNEFIQREYEAFKYVPGSEQAKWVMYKAEYSLLENLNARQVGTLRRVLKDNLKRNSSMREIISEVNQKVHPGDLLVKTPDLFDRKGDLVRKGSERILPSRVRSVMLARTETIRAANQGALAHYKSDGVEEVQWVSAFSSRTCAFCEAQNGKVMSIQDANEQIPAHSLCRCSFVSFIKG